MSWSLETSQGFESRKCRDRVVDHLHGIVLDIGCGDEKIVPYAVGVDIAGSAADIKLNMTSPHALRLFSDNSVDVVFSSHFLEDCFDHRSVLQEMWRVVKPHGKLILYLPHKDHYPNVGQPGANPNHKHDFVPEDIIEVLDEFASYKLIRKETYSEGEEYSFELLIEKIDTNGVPIRYEDPEKIEDNSVLIIRYGAFGDMLILSPVFRLFKERGYKVHFNCVPESYEALRYNPYIDKFHFQDTKAIPYEQLATYIEGLKKKYPKVINMARNIESMMLFEKHHNEFNLPHEERDMLASDNYYDKVLEMCGFEERGLRPEFHLSQMEECMGRYLRRKYEDQFVVLWQLSGSSDHKLYPYADAVIERLIEKYPDMVIFLSGANHQVRIMQEGNHPRVKPRVGVWHIRQALMFTKYVDLVVSPETAVLNAAGAFETPKIGLLTHSSKQNLTKYFLNDFSMQSKVDCSPCHKLVHFKEDCPCDSKIGMPVCMSVGFPPWELEAQIEMAYNQWKQVVK
jgi:ADP-heptose:LPS heptosyltransferase/predicted SAM-dependent methyltransferase